MNCKFFIEKRNKIQKIKIKIKKTLDKRKSLWYNKRVVKHDAGMAQSVEHVIGNDEVIGPNPISSSKTKRHRRMAVPFGFHAVDQQYSRRVSSAAVSMT